MRVSERVSHQLLVPDPYQTSPDSSQIFPRVEKRASCHANNWGVLLDDSNVLVNVSLTPVTLNCSFRKQVSAELVTELFFSGSVYVGLTN